METIVCDICGGKLQTKTKGIFVCTNCGVEYTTERMKEKVQEVIENPSEFEPLSAELSRPEPISPNRPKSTLPAAAANETEVYQLSVSDDYRRACSVIQNSTNIVTLETALKVLEQYKHLENCPETIRYGEEKVRRLKNYHRNAYLEQIYQEATNLAESGKNDIPSQQKAADMFNSISDWKDAKQQKSVCLENIKKIQKKQTSKKNLRIFLTAISGLLITAVLLVGFNAFELRDNLPVYFDDFKMNVSDTFGNLFSSTSDESDEYLEDEEFEDEPVFTNEKIKDNAEKKTGTTNRYGR